MHILLTGTAATAVLAFFTFSTLSFVEAQGTAFLTVGAYASAYTAVLGFLMIVWIVCAVSSVGNTDHSYYKIIIRQTGQFYKTWVWTFYVTALIAIAARYKKNKKKEKKRTTDSFF